jgi:hypothetical protein
MLLDRMGRAMSRVLKRPPHGWGHKPNARIGDWLLLVFMMFCTAQFFRWAEATIDAIIAL